MTFVVKVAKVIGFFRLVELHLEQKTCFNLVFMLL